MSKYITTNLGRLRALGFLEGLSFIILVFVGMPLKYYMDNPALVKSFGPIHGLLFCVYVFESIRVSIVKDWSFTKVTLWLLLASVFPFGTFIVDAKILKGLEE